MKWRLLDNSSQRTFAVVFETGEEVVAGLLRFAAETEAAAAALTALGALSDLTIGYFDWQKKAYRHIAIDEQVEVVALTGNFARGDDGKPALHAHIVVGKADGSACGGHLLKAHVRPTLEVVVTESPSHLQRRPDPETGLALIRLDETPRAA